MHYRAISYINLPKTYDEAILAQFVVHHATDSTRTIRVECLQCHHTCQILKCRLTVGILPADSWPTVYRQTLRELFFTFTNYSVIVVGCFQMPMTNFTATHFGWRNCFEYGH